MFDSRQLHFIFAIFECAKVDTGGGYTSFLSVRLPGLALPHSPHSQSSSRCLQYIIKQSKSLLDVQVIVYSLAILASSSS